MLKTAKNGLILHLVGSFGFSQIFFASPPPLQLRPVGPRRGQTFLSPPSKNLEKKPCRFTKNWLCDKIVIMCDNYFFICILLTHPTTHDGL